MIPAGNSTITSPTAFWSHLKYPYLGPSWKRGFLSFHYLVFYLLLLFRCECFTKKSISFIGGATQTKLECPSSALECRTARALQS